MEESAPQQDPAALMREGTDYLAAKNYVLAAERFGQALETLVRLHGDLGPETADCYYHYGNALLLKHSTSVEDRLFGPSLLQAAEGKLESECSQADDEAGEAVSELQESQEDPSSTVNEVASSAGSENEEDDLEVIWENLESARIIYERTLNYAGLLNVYSALGELENSRENFGAAIEEYSRALEIVDSSAQPRRAAELHYCLGLACLSNFGSETPAIQHFAESIDLLDRVKTQQPDLASELDEILTEIRVKLEDAKEQQTSLQTVRAESQSLSQHFDPPSNPESAVVDLGVFGKRKAALIESDHNLQSSELDVKAVKRDQSSVPEDPQKENEAAN